ncbi:MAG: DUF4118 domain-containing protein, partial [Polyangiaceae bacterium]|nr:DUF4118 domain-containing protein [Polyangiaceae bacterium]
LTAVRFGRGPSFLTAALGVAAYDFFFVAPFLTFEVEDVNYLLTFLMMFGVGLLVSELTGRIRRQERDALLREEQTAALFALSRDLGAADGAAGAAAVIARHASGLFGGRAWVLLPGEDGLRDAAASPPGAALEDRDMTVAKWSYEHGRPAGLGTDTLPGSSTVCAPLAIGGAVLGALALQPEPPAPLRLDQRELLDAVCRQAAFALERTRLAEEARASALRARAEEMRSSLLSAVSHDLRTPLAAITGAATSLRDDAGLDPGTQGELLESICEEADRLERLVANLLDMTRLESGAVALKRDWIPVEELIVSALTRLEGKLGARAVNLDLPADLPLISVDPVLLEQLLVNLLENAAKYTPPAAAIDVGARIEGGAAVVTVADRGPGLPPGAGERVFEKFYRGAHTGVPGAGLGLSICRGIAEAHGGAVRAEDRPGGGALLRVTIPLVGRAPAILPAEELPR